jgi:hypothetical protein
MCDATDDYKLLEIRFDYVWKWFVFHADQRVKMLNFFLIIIGVLANAYIQAYINIYSKHNISIINYLIGSIGIIISIAFILLDARNRQLIEIGEKDLKILEETIFNNFPKGKKGILFSKGILLEDEDTKHKLLIHHKILIPFVEGAILILFIFSLFFQL